MAGEITLVSGTEAAELFPPLGHGSPAVHVPGAARVEGRHLVDALLRATRLHGATTIDSSATVEAEHGAVRGVRVDGELIEADAVIAAAGAWSPALLAPLGLNIDVRPQKGQILHLRLPATVTSDWPVVLPPSSHYLLAFDDSRVVVGATREEDAGFDYRVTAAGLAEVLGYALAVAPGLATATHLETRIGFRPMSQDSLPFLGTSPTVTGLVIANGLGPTGLTLGPYAGFLAAQLALGAVPTLDLGPYDPLRP